MLKVVCRIWLAVMVVLVSFTAAHAQEFTEGVHYTALSKPVRTQDPTKVEVVELFGYWCPHCNSFERYLGPWKAKAPGYVDFKHYPVVFRGNQTEFAKAYFVAKALGVEEEAHPALFNLIHRQRGWINTGEELGAFFADLGVENKAFDKAYGSFSLNGQLNTAKRKAREYQLSGVPTMVVNGKYRITADQAGSQANMLKVVDYLVEKEKSAL